ncbi:3,4-dihydroxy-2-butanone 4-phosphate synthase [uncultured archaeon]|nr:3,4-dihydroxy-2-butanone 4-phosphate synthase [uncultured archaeon]
MLASYLSAMHSLPEALLALKKGRFAMLHDGDGRENEADLLLLAEKATPAKVRLLRKDAGGLICLATDGATAARLSLPFAADLLPPRLAAGGRRKMPYGDQSAFSISINHMRTFTGITDNDRARTISEFGRLVKRKGGSREFTRNFRTVGHVFLLVSRGLAKRKGHTELSISLAEMAGTTPAVVLCEMLSDSGKAASREEAASYAKKHGIPFIEGKQLVKLWQKQKK